jgi:outer membrane PBP1 activator LpoA protein
VIALNVPEVDAPLPNDFYVFSLQVETEARQVAHMAFGDGRRSAITLADEQPIVRRVQRAFVDEFSRQGGRVLSQLTFRGSDADLAALRDTLAAKQADMAFIALDKTRARLARRYLEGLTHVYATSEILEAKPDRASDAQLDGVRFVAMPWLVQRDHPAVMAYSGNSAEAPGASDGERLYAFGIDAYRVAAAFLRGVDLGREPLDGVTGRITLGRDRHFQRELTPVQFVDGRVQPLAPRV